MATSATALTDRGVTRKSLLVALAAALLINSLLVVVAVPALNRVVSPRYSIEFQDLYDLIADNLANGRGYRVEADTGPTMMREPGYPLFLTIVFRIAGHHIEAVRFANVLLAFGCALLLMRLARRVTGDSRTALVSSMLFLFYPGTIIAEARGGVEIGFICAVLLATLFLYRTLENRELWRYLIAGMFFGAATLVRSVVMSLPAALFIYLIVSAKGARERLGAFAKAALLSIGLAIVISPWALRNYALTKEFVPTASVAGVAVQEGLFTCRQLPLGREFEAAQLDAGKERAKLAERLGLAFVGRYYYQFFYDPKDELTFSKALLKQSAAEYRGDPLLLAGCGAKNVFFNFWFLGKTRQATWLNMALQGPLLALALGGAAALWRRGLLPKTGPMLTFIVYLPLLHALIIAHARHSIVVVPFLSIFAAVLIVAAWNRARRTASKGSVLAIDPQLGGLPRH